MLKVATLLVSVQEATGGNTVKFWMDCAVILLTSAYYKRRVTHCLVTLLISVQEETGGKVLSSGWNMQ